MSDSETRIPLHRRSTEPKARAVLAPISSSQLPAVEEEPPQPETLYGCPWCAPYGGRGGVPRNILAAWLDCYPELRPIDCESVVPGPRDDDIYSDVADVDEPEPPEAA